MAANGEALLLVIDLLGLGFLVFYGWYVFIEKNNPGVVGLSISAAVSVHVIGTIISYFGP